VFVRQRKDVSVEEKDKGKGMKDKNKTVSVMGEKGRDRGNVNVLVTDLRSATVGLSRS
jgi:hypothetical protein